MYSINANKVCQTLSLYVSSALLCSGAAAFGDSDPGDPRCSPADDPPELAKPGQTQTHQQETRPLLCRCDLSLCLLSVRMTFTCIKNHKTPCETDQGKPERRADKHAERQKNPQAGGRGDDEQGDVRIHTRRPGKTRHDVSHLPSTFIMTLFHKPWPVASAAQ